MKLLLDAHISGRIVGRALREKGHDVRTADAEGDLVGLSDRDLMELARREGRVLVTANVKDFMPLVTELAAGQRSHAGFIFVPKSVRNENFGLLISGIERALSQADWVDRVKWLGEG